jgi:hypothetical protein
MMRNELDTALLRFERIVSAPCGSAPTHTIATSRSRCKLPMGAGPARQQSSEAARIVRLISGLQDAFCRVR